MLTLFLLAAGALPQSTLPCLPQSTLPPPAVEVPVNPPPSNLPAGWAWGQVYYPQYPVYAPAWGGGFGGNCGPRG